MFDKKNKKMNRKEKRLAAARMALEKEAEKKKQK